MKKYTITYEDEFYNNESYYTKNVIQLRNLKYGKYTIKESEDSIYCFLEEEIKDFFNRIISLIKQTYIIYVAIMAIVGMMVLTEVELIKLFNYRNLYTLSLMVLFIYTIFQSSYILGYDTLKYYWKNIIFNAISCWVIYTIAFYSTKDIIALFYAILFYPIILNLIILIIKGCMKIYKYNYSSIEINDFSNIKIIGEGTVMIKNERKAKDRI